MRSSPEAPQSDVQIVCPEGRLDAQSASKLDDSLFTAEARSPRVILNCQRVTYVSSSSLRVILVHARSLRLRGGDLILCFLAPKVERVLRIAGFDRILQLLATEDDARRALQIAGEEARAASSPP